MMTPRERIKSVMHFEKPDVLPWVESFYDETLVKWFGEGLPADKLTVIEWDIERVSTRLLVFPTVKGFDPYSYFGCYRFGSLEVPVDTGPIPRFKQRVLKEDERYVEILTNIGVVAKRFKKAEYKWYSMPMFTSFPVIDKKSWEEYKKRLDPESPCRYPKDWDKDVYIEAFENHRNGTTRLSFNGFYGFGAQLMGIPAFNIAFYKDPELIHDMLEHWEYFTIEVIRDAVETLKDRIDLVFWWEDMAEKHGPNISPKLYREFLLPHYKRVTGFLRKNNIDRIMVDSDGNTKPILNLMIEAGITGHWPLEVNSGMNAVEIRGECGNKLFLSGNLDKRELAKGGEAMRREVDSKVPVLKEMGGYLPGADHQVHVEFTYEKFREYAECIKRLLPY